MFQEPASDRKKFKFPIKPDAQIIRGTIWVFVESKHECTNAWIEKIEEKFDFLWENRHELWVRKNGPVPTLMLTVANSIGPYSAQSLRGSKVVGTIRSHQSHNTLLAPYISSSKVKLLWCGGGIINVAAAHY